MTHKRWFKQLRRMEAYARGTANQVQSTRSKTIHKTREWRAILNAPGFQVASKRGGHADPTGTLECRMICRTAHCQGSKHKPCV